MAEEEVVEEESGGGGLLRAILIPMFTSALTAAAVGAAMWFYFVPKLQEQQKEQAEQAAKEAIPPSSLPQGGDTNESIVDQAHTRVKHTGLYHQYDSFVVSIFDREKVHYLRLKVSLEIAAQNVSDEITIKDPQIKDAMIFVLGDFTVRELLDNQAKLLVKDVLLKTLNKILGPGKVIDVYFTEFVVQ